jgi:hypothetical protein
MAKSDRAVFQESLKMWDQQTSGAEAAALLNPEKNLDRLVDEMFDNFCNLEMDKRNSFIGHC